MSAVLADPGPMARYEERIADAAVPDVVFQRLCGDETLKQIAVAWGLPVGRFTRWYMDTHGALYEAALKVKADQLAHEALTKADEANEDNASAKKLMVDTRLKLAGVWDRNRYGGKDTGSGANITVIVDRSCGGAVEVEAGGIKARVPLIGTEASA